MKGTLNYYIQQMGGSFIVRRTSDGEVMGFRPDAESAQHCCEILESNIAHSEQSDLFGGSK